LVKIELVVTERRDMFASVETCFMSRVDFNYGDIVRRGTGAGSRPVNAAL